MSTKPHVSEESIGKICAISTLNVLCDVGDDFRNGRLHLLHEELLFYGIREFDIAEGKLTR